MLYIQQQKTISIRRLAATIPHLIHPLLGYAFQASWKSKDMTSIVDYEQTRFGRIEMSTYCTIETNFLLETSNFPFIVQLQFTRCTRTRITQINRTTVNFEQRYGTIRAAWHRTLHAACISTSICVDVSMKYWIRTAGNEPTDKKQ